MAGKTPQILGLVGLLAVLVGAPRSGPALITSPFACSAGTKDGQACTSFTDCSGGGVCVIVQGVCQDTGSADVLVCDCPGGTCGSDSTCSGGVFAGDPCTMNDNCTAGISCQGSQKVCLGGTDSTQTPPVPLEGFSCTSDAQCGGSSCASTGKVCSGGNFDGFSCVNSTNCPGTAPTPNGACVGSGMPSPPPTGGTPLPTRTPTPTPVQTGQASVTPTRAPTAAVPTVGPNGFERVFIAQGAGCALGDPPGRGGTPLLLLPPILWWARQRARRHRDR